MAYNPWWFEGEYGDIISANTACDIAQAYRNHRKSATDIWYGECPISYVGGAGDDYRWVSYEHVLYTLQYVIDDHRLLLPVRLSTKVPLAFFIAGRFSSDDLYTHMHHRKVEDRILYYSQNVEKLYKNNLIGSKAGPLIYNGYLELFSLI